MGSRALIGVLLVLLLSAALYAAVRGTGRGSSENPLSNVSDRIFATNDAVERGCALDKEILARLWRGYTEGRMYELLFVPQHPNFTGTFSYWGHSGPWDYLQIVPLVLYGPRIEDRGRVRRPVDFTDVYPTMDELLDAGFPDRAGKPLHEALKDGGRGRPRLIVTIVLDAVGRNVLETWPGAWPNLARLEEEGTSYLEASVGSSPSITPATHATLGTGVYPRKHGIPSIHMREDDGSLTVANVGRNPVNLEATTFGDLYDRAHDDRPLVGLIGWSPWHLGLLGHGKQMAGGDADHLALFTGRGGILGDTELYATPRYLPGERSLEEHARALDRDDGEVDGKWLGREILGRHENPAWVYWQLDGVLRMLRREGYGKDRIPDLLAVNFKMADIVGHNYSMESPEMREVLRAEDDALGRVIDYLDEAVGDYVVIVTADHGHTPRAATTGGWPFDPDELNRDLQAHLGLSEDESITERPTGTGFFLDDAALREAGVTDDEITEFVNAYTIAENAVGELPAEYGDRGEEHVFSAAFMGGDFPAIMRCAFGAESPTRRAVD